MDTRREKIESFTPLTREFEHTYIKIHATLAACFMEGKQNPAGAASHQFKLFQSLWRKLSSHELYFKSIEDLDEYYQTLQKNVDKVIEDYCLLNSFSAKQFSPMIKKLCDYTVKLYYALRKQQYYFDQSKYYQSKNFIGELVSVQDNYTALKNDFEKITAMDMPSYLAEFQHGLHSLNNIFKERLSVTIETNTIQAVMGAYSLDNFMKLFGVIPTLESLDALAEKLEASIQANNSKLVNVFEKLIMQEIQTLLDADKLIQETINQEVVFLQTLTTDLQKKHQKNIDLLLQNKELLTNLSNVVDYLSNMTGVKDDVEIHLGYKAIKATLLHFPKQQAKEELESIIAHFEKTFDSYLYNFVAQFNYFQILNKQITSFDREMSALAQLIINMKSLSEETKKLTGQYSMIMQALPNILQAHLDAFHQNESFTLYWKRLSQKHLSKTMIGTGLGFGSGAVFAGVRFFFAPLPTTVTLGVSTVLGTVLASMATTPNKSSWLDYFRSSTINQSQAKMEDKSALMNRRI